MCWFFVNQSGLFCRYLVYLLYFVAYEISEQVFGSPCRVGHCAGFFRQASRASLLLQRPEVKTLLVCGSHLFLVVRFGTR